MAEITVGHLTQEGALVVGQLTARDQAQLTSQ